MPARDSLSQRLRLLSRLESGEPVSGETLARLLKISRQALHKQILGLRKSGYAIDGKPNEGYRLTGRPDRLSPEAVLPRLRTKTFGRSYHFYERTGSTQDRARELAQSGAPEGAVAVAADQTAGRGRLGREWVSGRGGLWASLILRPPLPPQTVPLLSLVASLAIAEAIERSSGTACGVKWPNDVLVPTKKGLRKVCGILTEMSAESDRVHWLIVGFGINANNEISPGLKGIGAGLKQLSGSSVDLPGLAAAVLGSFEKFYGRFLKEGFGPLRPAYLRRFLFRGKRVVIVDPAVRQEGICRGVGEDGSLKVEAADGRIESFLSGDVSLRTA